MGKTYKVIILEHNCQMGHYGEIIEVGRGVRDTLLNLGKAVELEDFEAGWCISEDEKLQINYYGFLEDYYKMKEENESLRDKVDRLTEQVETLKKQSKKDPTAEKKQYYQKNKMKTNYSKKNGKD